MTVNCHTTPCHLEIRGTTHIKHWFDQCRSVSKQSNGMVRVEFGGDFGAWLSNAVATDLCSRLLVALANPAVIPDCAGSLADLGEQ